MKKIIRKVKGKKVLSFVLAAIMLATTFNMALPMLKLDAGAAADIGGITQERVVLDHATKYPQYEQEFLNGAGEATDIIIPGLDAQNDDAFDTKNDFVIQGLSYYEKQDWIMVSAYHKDETLPSMIFALEAATGTFKYAFEILNSDGSVNTDHGGGLAFSKYNFYYSGDDSDKEDGDGNGNADRIAYAPLSYFDKPTDSDGDGFCEVKLKADVDLPEMNTAATAYVCYDEGILWAGNFYEDSTGAGNYNQAVITAPNLYNSMIYGYKLQGSDTDEEWAYLTGAKGNTTDCAGAPTHCIAIDTNIEDIQYAVVDKGRLYLSRSWGTGKNSQVIASVIGSIGSTPDWSTLTVADIDLSASGDRDITYSTGSGTKTVKAHYIDKYDNYDMMPMSEGLCFIEGNLYISFEGASNKYMNEYAWSTSALTNTGNCEYPIDVIWKVDPYKLLDEQRPSGEASSYYEKVSDLENIESGEEYLIVYESKQEDPVTQKNILYALDAFGGYKGFNLSKRDNSNFNGYVGSIGHPITEYSIAFEGEIDELGNSIARDRLYLSNPEKDDVNNLRWKLTKLADTDDGNADYYAIENQDFYFANNQKLFCDKDTICMAADNVPNVSKMRIYRNWVTGKGFWICNDDQQFLWCNDGTYNDKLNQWYSDNSSEPMYNGLKEKAGTFHTNGIQSDNIIGESISPVEGYYDGTFYLYKRVKNAYASTEESSLHTDMTAELQADGTYTVNLETFAVAPNHYKVGESRPTDYIFVLDGSASMATADVYDYVEKSGELTLETLIGKESVDAPESAGGFNFGETIKNKVHGYDFCRYDYYYKHNDMYRPIRVAVKTHKVVYAASFLGDLSMTSIRQYYWAYFVGTDGLYYIFNDPASADYATKPYRDGVNRKTFLSYVDDTNESNLNTSCTVTDNDLQSGDRMLNKMFIGTYYHLTYSSTSRLDYMKSAANTLADKILADSQSSGKDHRIAVTRFGGTTGLYNNQNGGFISKDSLTTDNYKSHALYSMEQISAVKGAINDLSAGGDGNSKAAFDMANQIITNSGENYKDTGDRSVVIVMFSSGIPGSDATSVANSAISTAGDGKYKNGATVYTVKIGNGEGTPSGFSPTIYMAGVSSKYPRASSLTTLNDENPNNKRYNVSFVSAADNRLSQILDSLFADVTKSSRTGLAFLRRDAIIAEELSGAFIVPSNAVYDVKYVPGSYDKIGRISFGTPNAASFTTDLAPYTAPETDQIALSITGEKSQKLEAWGYDYTNQYISPSHPGNMLRITLTGLLANPNAQIEHTTITKPAVTGLYKNSSNKTSFFKYFPTQNFSIPEYTYVLDYGLDMLDTNVNGTLKSVSADLSAQRDANGNLKYKSESENGLVKIDTDSNNQNLLYHTTPTNMNDSGYVLIQRDNGKYDWFEIKVVPASNVYFEEDDMVVKKVSSNKPKAVWEDAGNDAKPYRPLTEEGDVVGFDNTYNVPNQTYSNGNALVAKIDSTTTNSQIQTFDFVGTGIDIVSRCDKNTGMLLVNIKKQVKDENNETKMQFVKSSLVDTYCDEGPFNQTPVFSWSIDKAKGETYGTYTVEVSALYLSTSGALKANSTTKGIKNNLIDTGLEFNTSTDFDTEVLQAMLDEAGAEDVSAKDVELVWFDDNSIFNGGTGAAATRKSSKAIALDSNGKPILENYIDGFRVYNPLGTNQSAYEASEKNAKYVNVLDNLMDSTGTVGNIAYIIGKNDTLTWADYETVGPQGEVYLNKGQSISFNVTVDKAEKIMLGLRAVNGATSVTIANTANENYKVENVPINSATEMYYDITPCFGGVVGTNQLINITITNANNGILAVNHVKHSGGDSTVGGSNIVTRTTARSAGVTGTEELLFTPFTEDNLVDVQNNMNLPGVQGIVKNGVVLPLVEEEEEIPEDNTNTDNDNTNDGADTEGSENEEFSLFSLIEMLIAFIEKILYNAFGAGSIA